MLRAYTDHAGTSADFRLTGAQAAVSWQCGGGELQALAFEAHTDDPTDQSDGSQQHGGADDGQLSGDFFFYPTRTDAPWHLLIDLEGSATCYIVVSEQAD